MIPLYRPLISKKDIEAVVKTLESGNLTTGNVVREFEQEFAKFVGAPYALAFNNLTSAWLAWLSYQKPDRVLMPSATYVSMANMPKLLGITIEFLDQWISGQAYVIHTDKGKVIDSAHAVERDSFSQGPHACWLYSFHATKLLTTGTGGMMVLGSEDDYHFLRVLRDSGRLRTSRGFNYTVAYPGWNLYMNDMQAALGLSQLRRFDELMKLRDECYATYQKYLAPDTKDRRTKYLYQIWVDNIYGFADSMKALGIGVSKHFSPIHLQPAYKTDLRLPKTEDMCEHLISIPYYPEMKESDIKTVSEAVNRWRNNV